MVRLNYRISLNVPKKKSCTVQFNTVNILLFCVIRCFDKNIQLAWALLVFCVKPIRLIDNFFIIRPIVIHVIGCNVESNVC